MRTPARARSALWLGKIRDPCALEPLIAAFKDEDRDVRVEVVKALGEMRDARALELLSGRQGSRRRDLPSGDQGAGQDRPCTSRRDTAGCAQEYQKRGAPGNDRRQLGDTGDPARCNRCSTCSRTTTAGRCANAARSLVKLYRSNVLGQTEKQLILDQQELITDIYGLEFTI